MQDNQNTKCTNIFDDKKTLIGCYNCTNPTITPVYDKESNNVVCNFKPTVNYTYDPSTGNSNLITNSWTCNSNSVGKMVDLPAGTISSLDPDNKWNNKEPICQINAIAQVVNTISLPIFKIPDTINFWFGDRLKLSFLFELEF